jgi:hypothetical protein
MPGEMTFRKDCEECGRSFLTPDKKAKICQRCAGKGHEKLRPETVTPKGTTGRTQKSLGKSPISGPADDPATRVAQEIALNGSGHEATEPKVQQAPQAKGEAGLKGEPSTPDRRRVEVELTPAQIQEMVERYQTYVQRLERPPKGRRKTIAAEMGLPNRTIVLTLRQWNQQQTQLEELTREERFSVEKAYFYYLERKNFFSEIKAQISQETGVIPWGVSRYLDIIHDGEEKLRNVSHVSSEQETAILNEYQKYLSASGPPPSPLHHLIAERTGVIPKQVYKVLLSYRLSRFREKWAKHQNQ